MSDATTSMHPAETVVAHVPEQKVTFAWRILHRLSIFFGSLSLVGVVMLWLWVLYVNTGEQAAGVYGFGSVITTALLLFVITPVTLAFLACFVPYCLTFYVRRGQFGYGFSKVLGIIAGSWALFSIGLLVYVTQVAVVP